MIAINYRDPRPIYEQIQAELRRLMLTGALPPGSRRPSVRELAGQLVVLTSLVSVLTMFLAIFICKSLLLF